MKCGRARTLRRGGALSLGEPGRPSPKLQATLRRRSGLWPPWLPALGLLWEVSTLAKVQRPHSASAPTRCHAQCSGLRGDTDELDVGLALMGLSVEEPVDSDRTESRENQHF